MKWAPVGRRMAPQPPAGRRQERTEDARVVDALAALKDRGSADGPANQAFGGVEQLVHFVLCQFLYWARKVGEVKRLNRLDAEGDFVNDAAQAIARSDHVQQLGVVDLGGFGEVAGGRHPLDPRDVGTHLAELDAVKSVLAVAAGGRAERHVPDLDVRHELQSPARAEPRRL